MAAEEFIKSKIQERLTFLEGEIEETEANIYNYEQAIKLSKDSIKEYKKEIKFLKSLEL